MRLRIPGFLTELVDGAVVIVSVILVNVALALVAGIMAGVMEVNLAGEMTDLPRFDYVTALGTGNEIFGLYEQLRWAAYMVFTIGIILAIAFHFAFRQDFLRQKAAYMLFSIMLLAAFPFIWDAGAQLMEDGSKAVLNGLYTGDPDAPCPASWTDADVIDAYNGSPYRKGGEVWGPFPDLDRAMDVCRPEFRVNYVIWQMAGSQQVDIETDDPVEWLMRLLSGGITQLWSDLFLGAVKSIVTIQVGLMSVMIAVITDMLTGMIIGALPLLLILRLFPGFDAVADKLLTALPALFMIPLLTSIITVVGAATAASAITSPVAVASGGTDVGAAMMYVWISSMGTLFMSVALPLVMVPFIGRIVNQSTTIVAGAVMSSAFIAANVATGMAKGAASGQGMWKGALGGFAGSLSGAGGGGRGDGDGGPDGAGAADAGDGGDDDDGRG